MSWFLREDSRRPETALRTTITSTVKAVIPSKTTRNTAIDAPISPAPDEAMSELRQRNAKALPRKMESRPKGRGKLERARCAVVAC